MFGHDNGDNQNADNNGDVQSQITLPTAGGFNQDDNNATDSNGMTGAPEPVADASTPAAPAPPRQAPKTGAPTDDLLDIKQEALQALTPLVDHLEQSPEERFRTTMMMIQASDNHSLIKVAYEAAQQIADDKERAQALLDIVNEINYFTQTAQA